MNDVCDFLVRALELQPPDWPHEQIAETRCAITGQTITEGYPVQSVVTVATAEFMDCFRGRPFGYISIAAATCFKRWRETSKQLIVFEDGTAYWPMISRDSAIKQERPCWSELVRELWQTRKGERCACLLTTDMKKRLWPQARVGSLGHKTAIYLYDSGYSIAEVAWIDWPRMLGILDLIETVYTVGFSKEYMRTSLYGATKAIEQSGFKQARAWERALAQYRDSRDFDMALLIAQKREETE